MNALVHMAAQLAALAPRTTHRHDCDHCGATDPARFDPSYVSICKRCRSEREARRLRARRARQVQP